MYDLTLDTQFQEQLENLKSKYGEEMMKVEGMSADQLDTTRFFKNFIASNTVADASIDANANVSGKNISIMLNEAHKPFEKLLSRNKLYIEIREEFGKDTADEFLEKAVNGQLYEHDSHSSSYMPYCFAFSVAPIVENGLFFLNEMSAKAPQHWDTYNSHVLEFISYATNMQAGAVGIPDYLIYAYYFYKKDVAEYELEGKQEEKYLQQRFQHFIYALNQPYLKYGTQSAYTNVSILDRDHIIKFFGDKQYPDGSNILDHLDDLIAFQGEFLQAIGKIRQEKWYTFPVVSASLIFKSADSDHIEDAVFSDEETADMVIRHNWEYGFNDVNMMLVDQATSLASCCRLVSDKEQLEEDKMVGKVFNSIGGSDVNVGSTKVVTLNLVRHALLAEGDVDKFVASVEHDVKLIHKYHFAHRKTLKKLVDRGLLPLYTHGLMSFDDQFATVGINGVFEATQILGGIEQTESGVRYSDKGYQIMEEMFNAINTLNKTTVKEYGFSTNVEQIPAESTAVKLAKKDRLYFGNRYINETLGEENYIYGNQWIPLKENANILDRLDTAKLDNYCGGGAILHVNLGSPFNTFEEAKEFTLGMGRAGVKYFSYISLIDICEDDHSFFGDTCPMCGGPSVSKGIKIVGYLVKQDSYDSKRKQELNERKFYNAAASAQKLKGDN